MELRHLQTFIVATEMQSFTRAAESLSLTQAAVSQHIAALEKELGVALFERAGRSVKPTDNGRQLYDYARKILGLVDEIRSTIGQTETTVKGTLKIAASTVPAESLLPELLLGFRKQFPEVKEAITISDSASATEAVESGDVELGFVGELPRSSKLTALSVAEDELVLVLSPAHSWAKKKQITPEDLRAEPLIVREPGSGSRRCVEQALENVGVSPSELNIVMEMNSNDAIRSAIEQGVGIAFLSRAIVARELESGRLQTVYIEGVKANRQLYLVTDPDRIAAAPLRAFLEFLDGWLLVAK